MKTAVTAEPKSKKSKAEVSAEAARPAPSRFGLKAIAGAPAGMPLFMGLGLQRKLAVGAVDDPLEREADQVAEQVMRPVDPASFAVPRFLRGRGQYAHVQRKCACEGSASGECEECRKREEEPPGAPVIRRSVSGNGNSQLAGSPGSGTGHLSTTYSSEAPATQAPAIVHRALRSPSRPLDSSTLGFMQARFGRDFGAVRVHTDADAAASAAAIAANAYTAGNDIAFAQGQYLPETAAGQRLLAHELTHVLQQTSRNPSGSGSAAEGSVQRQLAGGQSCTSCHLPSPPPSGSPGSFGTGGFGSAYPPFSMGGPGFASMPPVGVTVGELGWTWIFDGVYMSTDLEALKRQLRQVVANRGLGGLDDWHRDLHQLHGPCPSCHTSGGRLDDIKDTERRTGPVPVEGILMVEVDAYYQVANEAKDFLAQFERNAKDTAKQTLEANRIQANREAARYGLSVEILTLDTEFGPLEIPNYQMEGPNDASKGLKDAANILLQRRQSVDDKISARDSHVTCTDYGTFYDDAYWPLDDEVKKMEADYKDLQSYVTDQYPILGRYSELDASLDPLKTIAAKGASPETANLIGAQITQTLSDIAKSKKGIDDGSVNVWRLESIIGLTEQSMGVTSTSMEGRLVKDKFDHEKPGLLQGVALAVLNIAALLLAGPTGGLSLVVAAGVNIAVTASHIQEYMMQKALAGSALQKERALSQEDPSLFWLAVEIVGTVFDVATAASAMLKAFRALAPVVKAAESAQKTEKAAESLELVSKTADEVGLGGKTGKILEHIKAGPAAEEEVIKDIAKGEKEAGELKSLAKTAAEEEEVAQKAAQSAEVAGGGKVRVTKTGDIWSCASPCRMLRDRYAARLARQPEWEAKVADLEKRAAQIAPGAEGDAARQTLAREAAKLEQEIRTTALPGDWTPAVKDDPKFSEMVSKRGSVAPELDRHPPNWSGKEEANFRYGAAAKPEPGYTWALSEDGSLVYRRTGFPPDLPPRRFNPATGIFEEATAEGEQAITRAKFVQGADATEKLEELTKAQKGLKEKMEGLFENRRKLMAERDRLEELEAGGNISDADKKVLSKLYAEINEQSRLLGENAAEAVMRSKGGVRVYPLAKAYSTAGDFDQVWKVGDEFYVIEAKGGSSGLGTRMVEGVRAEQGTGEYFGGIAKNMAEKGATKEIRQLGDQLLLAQTQGKVKYMLVRAPIGTEKGAAVLKDIQVRQFAIAAP